MITQQELHDGFTQLGLQNGDTVLVHSSYKSLGGVEGGPQTVVDTLLGILGELGTLVVPAFNFDFCKGQPFDIRTTPSQMGIITELVRKDPRSKRNLHPIYSFSMIGKYAEKWGNLRYTNSYGVGTIFDQLRKVYGKIMIIGLSYQNSMTFFHHVEEIQGCSYRYHKNFWGHVTNWDGETNLERYSIYVRDIDRGVETHVDPMGEVIEKEGYITVQQIGDATVRLMDACKVYERTVYHMRRNPELLYQIKESND